MFDFEFVLETDRDILEAYAEKLEEAPKTTAAFMSKLARNFDVVGKIKQYGLTTPGPVKYPIAWANPIPTPPGKRANMPGGLWSKQKAAFFATDGFGRGIPTKRTGKLLDRFAINFDNETLELTVYNDVPYARFVIGQYQQGFHANTGWKRADDAMLDIMIELQDELIDGFLAIVDIKGLI